MKNLSFFDKFLFLINSLIAFLFLLSLFIPLVKPSNFVYLSLFSLFTPILIVVNILFVFFWVIKMKRYFLLSLIVLFIGNDSLRSFINFSKSDKSTRENRISIISYNVRLFNLYNWLPIDGISEKVGDFLLNENSDLISLQEYHNDEFFLSNYPYKFENLSGKNLKYGQAIFSKYPIVYSSSLNFDNSSNNAIFSDIIINNDTVRVYNIHLESFSFEKYKYLNNIDKSNSISDISTTFLEQERQVQILKKSFMNCPYKMIITGDFNNTAFSYTYRELSKEFNDNFKEKGNGLGITHYYKNIPLRIDFILSDKDFIVNDFKTFKLGYSDHEPIYSKLEF
tara:strand:+ start:680 stop:1693 length:1014 start_codon:yes stop_codon:yes gene_type:complete